MLPAPRIAAPSIAVFEGWEFVRRPARKQKSLCHIHESSGRENRADGGHAGSANLGHQPADDYCFTGVADTLARALFSSSGLNPKGPGLLLYATWPVASIK
jgi:hypothetical protein